MAHPLFLFTGFTEADVKLLRLALIKFGIGKWSEIVASGCVIFVLAHVCVRLAWAVFRRLG